MLCIAPASHTRVRAHTAACAGRGCIDSKGERLLVFLPLAHVLARAITMAAFANFVTVGFTSDIKNLVPMFSAFKPTIVVSVPRVFEKVYNTAAQNAASEGKGRIFTIAAETAVEWSEANDRGGPDLLLRAKHALFDRLVYGKLRAALGGDCRASISGGAPLGARLVTSIAALA
jgi:long-chain acyl-CoA synthetase